MINVKEIFYLPSGRIFLMQTEDGSIIESTEMRDVSVGGKKHIEVRNSLDPTVIWKHLVNYKEKWLLTVSTQKGCSFKCKFCDVADISFKGNLSHYDIEEQIILLLEHSPFIKESKKVKIGFARMGEPACNIDNVILAMTSLYKISRTLRREFRWLPCFNTILPKNDAKSILNQVIDLKENIFDGFLHLQVSCNSTCEETRKYLFGGADVLSVEEIIDYVNHFDITDRTITLNFIVMDGIEVDVNKLKKMGLNSNKFMVKLIPLNKTINAEKNELNTYANYTNYDKLSELGQKFNEIGVPTVIDSIARCEEAGLCCGQLAQIFLND